MSKPGLAAMAPYRTAFEEETKRQKKTSKSGAKAPLTVDQREQKELTYLEQTYGEAAKRDAAAHQAAVKAQETARQSANRQAYIGNELMQKYLPQYQAMQGTGGMGTSQTDAAAAMNAYFGRVSANNAGYAQNVAALDAQKAETDYLRDAEKREKEFAIKDAYDAERQQMAEEESTGLLDTMAGRKKSFTGADEKISPEDYQNLWEFYTANEGRLTEAGKRNAQDMLAEYKLAIRDAEEQAAVDRLEYIDRGVTLSRGLTDYGKVGNNFWVKNENGTEYAVELGNKVTDQAVTGQAEKADSGDVFAYGGKLYIKSGSDVYEVNRREMSKHDQFEDLSSLYFGGKNAYQGGQEIEALNENGEREKITLGEVVEDAPAISKYVSTGGVFKVGKNRYIKDASGVVYKVK